MLYERYPALCACKADIEKALEMMLDAYRKGGKILVCGNGGSASDCEHIVGELMKGFLSKRPVTDERIPEGLRKGFREHFWRFLCPASVPLSPHLSITGLSLPLRRGGKSTFRL